MQAHNRMALLTPHVMVGKYIFYLPVFFFYRGMYLSTWRMTCGNGRASNRGWTRIARGWPRRYSIDSHQHMPLTLHLYNRKKENRNHPVGTRRFQIKRNGKIKTDEVYLIELTETFSWWKIGFHFFQFYVYVGLGKYLLISLKRRCQVLTANTTGLRTEQVHVFFVLGAFIQFRPLGAVDVLVGAIHVCNESKGQQNPVSEASAELFLINF